MDELERKGLGVHQLLGMELPGDLTLQEAKDAIKRQEAWKALVGMAKEPERVDILFGWRWWIDGEEQWAPLDITLDEWKAGLERDPFISITDGSGGIGVKTPDLVDA